MKRLSDYLRSALYHIRHNKAYALFCILGTALTFVFVIILLQLVHTVSSNEAPLGNADRTIRLGRMYTDYGPEHDWRAYCQWEVQDVVSMRDLVKGYEKMGVSHVESVNPVIGGKLKNVVANYVNGDYWDIHDFDFVAGRAFTIEDYQAATPVAVIKESNARKYFGSPEEALDQTIDLQRNTFRIIGVVADFSSLSANEWSTLWLPYVYNKGVPSGWSDYTIEYLFPATMPVAEMKENVMRAARHHWGQQDKEIVEPTELHTVREEITALIGDRMLTYGIWVVILVLLVIPAVNIVTLSTANIETRAGEIALRRALGASNGQAFLQMISENLVLVLIGTVLGLLLVYPTFDLIETYILDVTTGEGASLLGAMNWWVVLLGVLPLSVLFALMSGGIPAWVAVRRNIAGTLKGGEQNSMDTSVLGRRKKFIGIYIEQALVFGVLMFCMVSVFNKIRVFRAPGLLDTDNTMVFGFTTPPGYNFWNSVAEGIQVLNRIGKEMSEELSYVEGVTRTNNLLPYGAPSTGMIFTFESEGKNYPVLMTTADPTASEVLRPVLDEGEWLPTGQTDYTPIIISRSFADSLGWHEAVGKKLNFYDGREFRVVGVLAGFRTNAFDPESKPMALVSTSYFLQSMGTTGDNYSCARLTDAQYKEEFSDEFYRRFKKEIGEDNRVEPYVADMERYKTEQILKGTAPLIAQGIPTVFFLIFGFVGTFGLFWLYSRKRVEEFALRRAVGATKNRLVGMVMTESVVLTLLAAVPGFLLAVFVYSWNGVVVLGVGATLAVMLLFSVFSAWYPAYKVSRVSPAEALHNE